jgi:hypothetical protein
MKNRLIILLVSFLISSFIINLALFGGLLNVTAMLSNNGKMPVLLMDYKFDDGTILPKENYSFEDEEHFSFYDKKQIKNYYLVDIIPIKDYRYSIGDMFMIFALIIGMLQLIIIPRKLYQIMKEEKKNGN